MKKIIFIILSISIIFSLDLPLDRTAILLEKGQKEIGICHPFRLGKTKDIEYSIHPILGFLIPNLCFIRDAILGTVSHCMFPDFTSP